MLVKKYCVKKGKRNKIMTRELYYKRAKRVRNKIRRVSDRCRLSVFKSNQYIYAQIIDDINGVTLVSASTLEKELRSKLVKTKNIQAASEVGKLIAQRAKAAKIKEVVFDKGAFLYHGSVKALADAARENGLSF